MIIPQQKYILCKIAQTGNGNTIYYFNGRVMAYESGKEGATWCHSSVQVMTFNGEKIAQAEMLYPYRYLN